MSSAVLHLMKIMPALPERRAAGGRRRARAGHDPLEEFVEIVEAHQAHPQVAVGRPVVDARDREVQVDRIGVTLQGQLRADCELLVLGELAADHAAVFVFLKLLELVGGNRQLVEDLEDRDRDRRRTGQTA